MADKTKIEWTDATWNPITGCSIVSPGCTNCYAMKLAGTRLKHIKSRKGLTKDTKAGPVWTGEVRFNEEWLDQPLRWKTPRMIFVCAHGDLFAEGVPDEWIDKVFAVMALAPQHTFQVLTKRPERMREYLTRAAGDGKQDIRNHLAWDVTIDVMNRWHPAWKSEDIDGPHRSRAIGAFNTWPLPNVWLGVSVEDQKRADERIPLLLDTPAAVRWISAEPLLGKLDLRAFVPDGWKYKQPIRDWTDFSWPTWVPEAVRSDIKSFWNPDWNRGPNAWMRGALDNGQPPLGTRGKFRTLRNGEPLIEGRFVPSWNNIGRVITDDGNIHCVSAGIYQSRPPRIDWIVAGGESGHGARPMHPDWARSLRDQCTATGVAFNFKQWGAWAPGEWAFNLNDEVCFLPDDDRVRVKGLDDHERAPKRMQFWDATREPEGVGSLHVGKGAAGRMLDGVTHDAFPEVNHG